VPQRSTSLQGDVSLGMIAAALAALTMALAVYLIQ
jgi:hypothetical protein